MNSTFFGQFLCTSSAFFHCKHSHVLCHTGLLTAASMIRMERNLVGFIIRNAPQNITNYV